MQCEPGNMYVTGAAHQVIFEIEVKDAPKKRHAALGSTHKTPVQSSLSAKLNENATNVNSDPCCQRNATVLTCHSISKRKIKMQDVVVKLLLPHRLASVYSECGAKSLDLGGIFSLDSWLGTLPFSR